MPASAAVRFSREYVRAIVDHLHIDIDSSMCHSDVASLGEATLLRLKADLGDLMHQGLARDAVESVKGFGSDPDGGLQSLAYGYVPDFDLMVKLGFFMGRRVILWDLIWGRYLHNDAPVQFTLDAALNLAAWRNAIDRGLLVILPDPGAVDRSTAEELDAELKHNPNLSNADYGLIKASCVANGLAVSPYTLSDDSIGIHSGLHSALTRLLRWRARFDWVADVPPSDFVDVLRKYPSIQAELRALYSRVVVGDDVGRAAAMEQFPAEVERTIAAEARATRLRQQEEDVTAVAAGMGVWQVAYGFFSDQLFSAALGAMLFSAASIRAIVAHRRASIGAPVLAQVFSKLRAKSQ